MSRSDQGIAASKERWHVVPRTLCFVTHKDNVLLLKGTLNKRIWPGKYNGIGGHVERNEDVLQAARREIREEASLEVESIRLRGVVNIDAGAPQTGIMLFIFTARATHRKTVQSPEGHLEWYPFDKLPKDDLVEDLEIILPRTLAVMADNAPPFFAHYWYDNADRLHIDFADS